jgi:hypothetical protein
MAEEAAPAGTPAGAVTFRSIGELAELCGHYCWVERRLFEVTGSRACGPATEDVATRGEATGGTAGVAEVRVVLSQMSTRHGLLAAQWRDRLPVRAGVDAQALVTPPPGPTAEVLDRVEAEPSLALALGGLAQQFLPFLLDSYDRNLTRASPVSEAPVRALLGFAAQSTGSEIREAGLLLDGLAPAGERVGSGGNFGAALQRLLEDGSGTFPGARAS